MSLRVAGCFAARPLAEALLTDLHRSRSSATIPTERSPSQSSAQDPSSVHRLTFHRNSDESFYIVEGTFDFSLAGQAFTAGAGAFVHLPKGVVLTHRAGGGASARAFVIQSPAGVERFIEEAGKLATDPSVRPARLSELERIVAIARKHGIEVPPIDPAAG